MFTAGNPAEYPCELGLWDQDDNRWRISLALDLEDRSVLEGEVLLSRITEHNTALNQTTAP